MAKMMKKMEGSKKDMASDKKQKMSSKVTISASGSNKKMAMMIAKKMASKGMK